MDTKLNSIFFIQAPNLLNVRAATLDSSSTNVETTKKSDEILNLKKSDNLGIALITVPLDGTNYLSCSRSMIIVLKTKDNWVLSIANTLFLMRALTNSSDKYETWLKVDSMVTSWILNYLSNDVVESFLYATLARQLWKDIQKRFEEAMGPFSTSLSER